MSAALDAVVALDRALARDRSVPGETRYLEVGPAALADVVIDSTELDRLRVVRG